MLWLTEVFNFGDTSIRRQKDLFNLKSAKFIDFNELFFEFLYWVCFIFPVIVKTSLVIRLNNGSFIWISTDLVRQFGIKLNQQLVEFIIVFYINSCRVSVIRGSNNQTGWKVLKLATLIFYSVFKIRITRIQNELTGKGLLASLIFDCHEKK